MGLDCRLNEILPTVVEESTSFPFIKVIFIDLLQLKDMESKRYTWVWNDLFVYDLIEYLFGISLIQYDQKQKWWSYKFNCMITRLPFICVLDFATWYNKRDYYNKN